MEQTSVKLLYLEIKERHLNPGIFHYWKLEMSKAHEIYIYIYMTRYFSKDEKSYIIFIQFSVCREYIPNEDHYPHLIRRETSIDLFS